MGARLRVLRQPGVSTTLATLGVVASSVGCRYDGVDVPMFPIACGVRVLSRPATALMSCPDRSEVQVALHVDRITSSPAELAMRRLRPGDRFAAGVVGAGGDGLRHGAGGSFDDTRVCQYRAPRCAGRALRSAPGDLRPLVNRHDDVVAHQRARLHDPWHFRPSGCAGLTAARSVSPVEICGTPYFGRWWLQAR